MSAGIPHKLAAAPLPRAPSAPAPAVRAAALNHAARLFEGLLAAARRAGQLPRFTDGARGAVVGDPGLDGMLRSLSQAGEPAAFPAIRDAVAQTRRQLDEARRHHPDDALVRLLDAFGADAARADVLLLVLAPELDLRFCRLYAFLHGDPETQRPVWGYLDLVDAAATAALARAGLLAAPRGEAPRANTVVHATRAVLDALHDPCAGLVPERSWDELVYARGAREPLARELARHLDAAGARPVLVVGAPGSGRASAVAAAATAAGRPLFAVAAAALPEEEREAAVLAALLRARLAGGAALVRAEGELTPAALRAAARAARAWETPLFVALSDEDAAARLTDIELARVTLPPVGPRERAELWGRALAGRGVECPARDEIAVCFPLTPGGVHTAAEDACRALADLGRRRLDLEDARRSVRALTAARLRDLATPVGSALALADIIVAPAVRDRLDELVTRARWRYRVYASWRFGEARGATGVSALFAGPPGTGKTAAAAAVARELGIDLYVVDLSRVLSKWVGETERNLGRIFDEAEAAGAALLFDEADALFGKRTTEVRSSSDRYANTTVGYLLERVDRYAGLALLTTNLESTMDAAFRRRLSVHVHFPEPDEQERLTLWRALLPEGAAYAPGVDVPRLARDYRLVGARIRNILVRAAFAAAPRGDVCLLTDADLRASAVVEYENMGRLRGASGQ